MTNDTSLVVAPSAATRRPPHDRRPSHGDEPRQPTVAVERVADERQCSEGRQQSGAVRRQRTVAKCRQSVVVEEDTLKSRRVT